MACGPARYGLFSTTENTTAANLPPGFSTRRTSESARWTSGTNWRLKRAIDASNELARLRAVIDEAMEMRLPPAAALNWLHADAPVRLAA